jgi:hypothetical protein
MTLKNRLKAPGILLRGGFVFLILASLSKWFLQPASGFSEDWIQFSKTRFPLQCCFAGSSYWL